jgi:hypothetical protein
MPMLIAGRKVECRIKEAHGAITLIAEQSYSPRGAALKHLEAASAISSAYGSIGTGQRICRKYRPHGTHHKRSYSAFNPFYMPAYRA